MAQTPRKKSSAATPSTVQPSTVKSSTVQPSTVKSSTVKSSTVKSSTVKSKSSNGPAPIEDVVLVHGRTEDGALQVIRKKGDELSAGELRPVEEGKPLRGNLLKLRPREDMPLLADVEEEIAITSPSLSKPPQVATDSYRKGWDGLWGGRKKRSSAAN